MAGGLCRRFLADGFAVDEIRSALRVRGGGKDRVAVVGEHFQPACDIGGVVFARLKREFKVGTEETRGTDGEPQSSAILFSDSFV
jgi:hypothetical protein